MSVADGKFCSLSQCDGSGFIRSRSGKGFWYSVPCKCAHTPEQINAWSEQMKAKKAARRAAKP